MKIGIKKLIFLVLTSSLLLELFFISCKPNKEFPLQEHPSSQPEAKKPNDIIPDSDEKIPKKTLKLNAISYNLSWATQKNIRAGTEINFVKACQKKSNDFFQTQAKAISFCTKNAADALLNYINQGHEIDLLAIQEGTEFTKNFIYYINTSLGSQYLSSIESKVSSTAILFMLYREAVLGVGQEVIKGQFEPGRPYQVIYFPSSETIAINTHFPHGFSKNKYEKSISDLEINVKNNLINWKNVKRVLFMGDFNDHSKKFVSNLDKSFYFLGHKLKMKGKAPKTCCWKSYSFRSDYIFDSEKQKSFGVVPGMRTKKTNTLMSDHDPVLSTSY